MPQSRRHGLQVAEVALLQRGVDRGELDADVDFAFIYDLLVGPLFMRAVVWGEQLAPDAAEKTADVILTAFAPTEGPTTKSARPGTD